MENKYLRNYIHKYLNLEEGEFTDPNEKMLKELVIYSQYEIKTKKCDSSHIYENLFHKYIDKKITFVEVGVAKGGSLFMWRDYFGNKAKIIGVDF